MPSPVLWGITLPRLLYFTHRVLLEGGEGRFLQTLLRGSNTWDDHTQPLRGCFESRKGHTHPFFFDFGQDFLNKITNWDVQACANSARNDALFSVFLGFFITNLACSGSTFLLTNTDRVSCVQMLANKWKQHRYHHMLACRTITKRDHPWPHIGAIFDHKIKIIMRGPMKISQMI